MPLEFWVAVEEGQHLQLDDVVEVATPLPDGSEIRLFGVVDLVRARHEGATFDSDVFLIEKGILPAQVSQAAHGVAEASELADRSARELPRFASDAARDPRAPQNLLPVGGLESRLKHLLGDPLVLRRAVEVSLHNEVTA
jgi:hypothetical protein